MISTTLQGDQVLIEVERALKQLHGEGNSRVTLDVRENSLVVTPVNESLDADYQKATDEVHLQYAEAFRSLANNPGGQYWVLRKELI